MTFRSRSLAFALLCLPLGALGCSGDSEPADEAPGTTQDPDCEAPGIVDPTLLIDDMEDSNALLAAVATRNGSWWISTDGTGGTVTPEAEMATPAERVLGGRCGSKFAMHVTGSGFSAWGAVLSAGFRYTNDIASIDASAFRGVTFYARVGADNTGKFRAQFQDSSTHPVSGICNPVSGSADECYNGFGADLSGLSEEWQKYTLEFSALHQRADWGYRADALDTSVLYDLEWSLDPNRTFDLWLDDVWFYE